MSWPNRSVWSSIDPQTAWWYTGVNIIGTAPFATASVCQTIGPSVVIHLQQILKDALAPGWKIPDGESQAGRPLVTGYLDTGTLGALAAYATMLGDAPSADMVPEIMDAVGQVGQTGAKATPALTRYILWVTYYRKSIVVADEFFGGARTTRAPMLGEMPPDRIFFSVLDLSDEEVACINVLRKNIGDKCTTLFEELGSTDAKFLPLVSGGTIPPALMESLAASRPTCAKYATMRDAYVRSVGSPAAAPAPLANEEVFMAWRNWILAQASGGRKPPPNTVPGPTPGGASPPRATGGGSSWFWLVLLAGGAYAATRD